MAYSQVNALLFLSKDEKLLISSSWKRCTLTYQLFVRFALRTFSVGDQAIYFDLDCSRSMLDALKMLKNKLDQDWLPRWAGQMENIPRDWETVAKQMLAVATDSDASHKVG